MHCPECGAATRAISSDPKRGIVTRVCFVGHRWHFRKDSLEPVARSFVRIVDPICAFDGCTRTKRGWGTNIGTKRWCEGHEKQRYRHGEEGMRPLLSANNLRSCIQCGADFIAPHYSSRICSDACRTERDRRRK